MKFNYQILIRLICLALLILFANYLWDGIINLYDIIAPLAILILGFNEYILVKKSKRNKDN